MAESIPAAAEPDLDRLSAGQVVVRETRLDDTGGSVRVAVLVDSPARTVWRVISNCEDAHRYVAGMLECEVLVDERTRALTHHVVDPGWFAPTMEYEFETRRTPFTLMEFALTDGNLKQMEGYWRIEPLGSGVLVEHELRIQPRVPAPAWLIRRKLKRDLPDMMTCIRALADGSLSAEAAMGDRASCQDGGQAPGQ